ncbi:MAG: class I SAM-dependent methyltransferase [Saprospiraceae bacterium]|nr:class I SAM-dependent methyltransferase [Saprospiraceae bacterium]
MILAGLCLLLLSACGNGDPTTNEQPPADPPPQDTTVQKGFDDMSSDYYEAETRVIWQKPDLVLNLLGDLTDKTVADIGAGTGYFAFRIAAIGGNVIAIDIDDRAISWMNREKERYPEDVRKRFETRLATATDPGLKADEVDMVLMVNTYMYISDRERYLRDLIPAIKPGGKVIIVDFKKKETQIGPAVAQRIAATEVQRELTTAGYAIVNSDDNALEFQYIITAIRPQ